MRKVEKSVLSKVDWETIKDMPDSEIGDIIEDVLKNNKIKKSMMRGLDYDSEEKFAMAVRYIKAKSLMLIENTMNPVVNGVTYKIELHDSYYTYRVLKIENTNQTKTEDKGVKMVDNDKGVIKTYLDVYKRLSLTEGIAYKKMKLILEQYESDNNGEWTISGDAFKTVPNEELNEVISNLYDILDASKSTLPIYGITMKNSGPILNTFIYLTPDHIEVFNHLYTYDPEFKTAFETAFGEGSTPYFIGEMLENKTKFVGNHGSFLKLMKLVREINNQFDGLITGGWRSIYAGNKDSIIVQTAPDTEVCTPLVKEPYIQTDMVSAIADAPLTSVDKGVDEMITFLNEFGDLADGKIYTNLGFTDKKEFNSDSGFINKNVLEQKEILSKFSSERVEMVAWIKVSMTEFMEITKRLEDVTTPEAAVSEVDSVAGTPPAITVSNVDIEIYDKTLKMLKDACTAQLIDDVILTIRDSVGYEYKTLPVLTKDDTKLSFYKIMYVVTRILEFLKVEGKYPASGMFDSSAAKSVDRMLATYEMIEDDTLKIGTQDQNMFSRAKDLFNSNINAADRNAVEEIVGFAFTKLNKLDDRTTKHRFKEILYTMVWTLIHKGNSQLIKEHHIYELDRCVNTLDDELVKRFGKLNVEGHIQPSAANELLKLIMGGK